MKSVPTRSLPFLVIAVLVEFVFASKRNRRDGGDSASQQTA